MTKVYRKKKAFHQVDNIYEKQFLLVAIFVIASLYRGVEETIPKDLFGVGAELLSAVRTYTTVFKVPWV